MNVFYQPIFAHDIHKILSSAYKVAHFVDQLHRRKSNGQSHVLSQRPIKFVIFHFHGVLGVCFVTQDMSPKVEALP